MLFLSCLVVFFTSTEGIRIATILLRVDALTVVFEAISRAKANMDDEDDIVIPNLDEDDDNDLCTMDLG
jgi:hypothetical protein